MNISTKSKVWQWVPYLPPSYANLTMRFFELTFYDLCKDRFGEDLGNFIVENWSCFLDDCETLLEENKISPNDLLSILNSVLTHQFNLQWNIVKLPLLSWTF